MPITHEQLKEITDRPLLAPGARRTIRFASTQRRSSTSSGTAKGRICI